MDDDSSVPTRCVYISSVKLTRDLSDLTTLTASAAPPPCSDWRHIDSSLSDLPSIKVDKTLIDSHDIRGCIPVFVLIMDARAGSYDFIRIWIDVANNFSVTDLVKLLKDSIPKEWKEDYDGIYQAQGTKFTQMINILRLEKYDLQPNEILILKPSSMSSKVGHVFAKSLVHHLTDTGVVKPRDEERSSLLISKEGLERVYARNVIHLDGGALEFISFSRKVVCDSSIIITPTPQPETDRMMNDADGRVFEILSLLNCCQGVEKVDLELVPSIDYDFTGKAGLYEANLLTINEQANIQSEHNS